MRAGGRRVRPAAIAVLGVLLAVAAIAGPGSAAAGEPTDAAAGPLAEPVWLCRPGLPANPCDQDRRGTAGHDPVTARYPGSGHRVGLDTLFARDGHREPLTPPKAPRVDCFYVYPTVDLVANPALRIGARPPRPRDAEMQATLVQAALHLSGCRMFVPVYRQTPLTGLLVPALTRSDPDFSGPGQSDIDQAWRAYWAHDNRDADGHRRGVVLIGHSQGTRVLTSLIRRVIESDPEQRGQLVSAVLLGGDVLGVDPERPPADGGAGASFRILPTCVATHPHGRVPTGCVVAYSAYRQPEGEPLPPSAAFGRSDRPGYRVLCTNPAALLAGVAPDATTRLDTRLPTRRTLDSSGAGGVVTGLLTGRRTPDADAGYVSYLGSVTGRCAAHRDRAGTADWLQVDGPDEVVGRPSSGGIGQHVLDHSVALGDLAALVGAQARQWSAGRS